MTVVELLKVMDNPNLTEPERQIVNIYTDSVYRGSGGYWKGTINEFLSRYNLGYYQLIGNAKVLKLTHSCNGYSGEFEPEIVCEDF